MKKSIRCGEVALDTYMTSSGKSINIDELYDVIDKYNTSIPVSGDWDSEIFHELQTIVDHFDLSVEDAQDIMIEVLGFDPSDFKKTANSSKEVKMKSIKATNWEYTLSTGKGLREAIQNDDFEDVLDLLELSWMEIQREFPEEYDEDELASDLEDIDNERDNLENYEDYDLTWDDVEDNINYLLNNLYDFCDSFRIWIDI